MSVVCERKVGINVVLADEKKVAEGLVRFRNRMVRARKVGKQRYSTPSKLTAYGVLES